MGRHCTLVVLAGGALLIAAAGAQTLTAPLTYCVVDTGQRHCFSDTGQLFRAPRRGEPFFGQDGHYEGRQPQYRDNGDGTASDLNTGLMWQKRFDMDRKLTWAEVQRRPPLARTGGHADWRIPSIKELYSLIDFSGNVRTTPPTPYLDARQFAFQYGDEAKGERIIDAQYWSSTEYVGLTMNGSATVFGVNFADGRIKGYPRDMNRQGATRHFLRLVRGNPEYGRNRFVDNRDGTISDLATGLMWAAADGGQALDWQRALAYCEDLALAGHRDWRLPNAKELQSIVDYSRAPDARNPAARGPAINPLFSLSDAEAWCWTSTTHLEGGPVCGRDAVYIAFGRAMGSMTGPDGRRRAMNVHGAGAQRSDPKSGDPRTPMWANGRGPQGDEVRINNCVRAVRNIDPGAARLVEPSVRPLPPSKRGPPGAGSPPGGNPRRPGARRGTPP